MHRIAGVVVTILGTIAAIAIVAGVARYAFASSDTAADGAIWAVCFGVVALLALAGPMLAVLLGRISTSWATAAWIVAGAAFLINVSNSLGAISSRGDKTQAERSKALSANKDDRAQLARIERERAAMTFAAADAEAVQAAQAAATSAEAIRLRECGNGDPKQRGPNCRQRETEEQTKRDALATILANKSATDHAAKLERDAEAIRARLKDATLVTTTNPHGDALARALGLADAETAATAQQVALVGFVELAIAFLLAAGEKLIEWKPRVREEPTGEVTVPAAASAEQVEIELPAATAPLPEVDTVGRFMLACLRKASGEEVVGGAIYARHQRWCSEQVPPLPTLDPRSFAQQFAARCERHGIRTRRDGSKVYCVDVQLVA